MNGGIRQDGGHAARLWIWPSSEDEWLLNNDYGFDDRPFIF